MECALARFERRRPPPGLVDALLRAHPPGTDRVLWRLVECDEYASVVYSAVKSRRRASSLSVDSSGRPAVHISTGLCRRRLLEALYLLGRYELLNAETPKHRSATCVVVFARDHGSGGDGDGAGSDAASDAAVAGASAADCVLKLMRNREQWERELAARGGTLEDGSCLPAQQKQLLEPVSESAPQPPEGVSGSSSDAAGWAGGSAANDVLAAGAGENAPTTGGPARKQRFLPEHVMPVLRRRAPGICRDT